MNQESLSIPDLIAHKRAAMTAEELGELLQVQRDSLLQWAREGRIPAMKVNGCVRFDPKEIAEWLRLRSKPIREVRKRTR
jgi:excisionase family DNA binding protein